MQERAFHSLGPKICQVFAGRWAPCPGVRVREAGRSKRVWAQSRSARRTPQSMGTWGLRGGVSSRAPEARHCGVCHSWRSGRESSVAVIGPGGGVSILI